MSIRFLPWGRDSKGDTRVIVWWWGRGRWRYVLVTGPRMTVAKLTQQNIRCKSKYVRNGIDDPHNWEGDDVCFWNLEWQWQRWCQRQLPNPGGGLKPYSEQGRGEWIQFSEVQHRAIDENLQTRQSLFRTQRLTISSKLPLKSILLLLVVSARHDTWIATTPQI